MYDFESLSCVSGQGYGQTNPGYAPGPGQPPPAGQQVVMQRQ